MATPGGTYFAGNWLIDFAAEYQFSEERVIPVEPGYEQPGTDQMDIFAWSIGLGCAFYIYFS